MSRAIEYRAFGGLEVLGEAERPAQTPGDGEVRIAMRTVGLNPLDSETFRGDLRRLERVQRIPHPRRWLESASARFPRGMACGFADVTDAAGANVTDLAVGGAVLGTLRSAPGQTDIRGVLTAELVAPASNVIKKPIPLSLMQAACLDVAAQTVYNTFEQLNVHEGSVIVVSTATGGAGSVASQLAMSRGAIVTGIAGVCNTDYLRSLGAIPVTYGGNLISRTRGAAPSPVTKLLNYYGSTYVRLGYDLGLTDHSTGTLVPSPAAIVKGVQFTGSRHSSGRGDLEEVAELAADDVIRVKLAHTYSFTPEQIRTAYTELAKGYIRGKLIIDLF